MMIVKKRIELKEVRLKGIEIKKGYFERDSNTHCVARMAKTVCEKCEICKVWPCHLLGISHRMCRRA